ncbi:MAG: MFS transporter [Kiritimatiellae bacterium]|nr:MFS transporter [Kiritimatiellia bacterium]
MASWQRNLVFVWLSQFLSIMGFMLALPFAPYYIQTLGVTDPTAVKVWTAVSQSATAVSLAIMGPIWGILADRHGRKLMMMRANFCAIVVLTSMAFAPNPWVFVALRFMQGALTGTMNAAMAFVASYSPTRRQGMALGTLSAAVFSGGMAGPALGGFLAETIGYRLTFVAAGQLLLLSALSVTFFVREDFVRPEQTETPPGRAVTWRERVAALGPGGPILILVMLGSLARQFDAAYLPLFVQELHGQLEGAARRTGLLCAVAAVGATGSGPLLGMLADRLSPPRVGKLSAVGAGLCMACTGFCVSFVHLIPVRFLLAFMAGGLDPVFLAWLARVTPEDRRATIFGWSTTAKSLGWTIAPLLGAAITVPLGLRAIFFVGLVWFAILVPVIGFVSRKVLDLGRRSV